MGLSGRAASRNAMAKMNGSTPTGSRSGTPGPSQDSVKPEDDEDDDLAVKGPGGVRKKLLKKGLTNKLKKDKSLTPANGKLPKSLAAKRPPGSGARASPAPSSVADKRDREEMLLGEEGDEEENVHVKKRQKLNRVGSTVSIAPTMDRSESQDGSFVDDASFADD